MNNDQNSVSEQMIALLTRCLQLQSEKDDISRPLPDQAPIGLSGTFDDFARQIHQACLYASMTDSLLAMQSRLDTGRQRNSMGISASNTVIAMPPPRLPGLNNSRAR